MTGPEVLIDVDLGDVAIDELVVTSLERGLPDAVQVVTSPATVVTVEVVIVSVSLAVWPSTSVMVTAILSGLLVPEISRLSLSV